MKLWLRATFEQERRNPYGLEKPLNVEEESTEFKLWLAAAEQEDTEVRSPVFEHRLDYTLPLTEHRDSCHD